MEKLKLKIHPSFIIFACVLIFFGDQVLFLNYFVVIIIHEFCHAIVARHLGYRLNNIKLIPFGICLNINSSGLMPKDEIKIALAGPVANFILAIFTMSIWWIVPSTFNFSYLFCYANFITGLFNLIPAFPLDGGRVLFSILKLRLTNKSAIRYCKIINIFVAVFLFGLFVFSCFYTPNFTYLFVILCVLSGVFEKDINQKYTFIDFSSQKKISKVVKVKNLCINYNEFVYKVCKFIDNFSYVNFYICDDEKNLIAFLTEANFLELIEKVNIMNTFKNLIENNQISLNRLFSQKSIKF